MCGFRARPPLPPPPRFPAGVQAATPRPTEPSGQRNRNLCSGPAWLDAAGHPLPVPCTGAVCRAHHTEPDCGVCVCFLGGVCVSSTTRPVPPPPRHAPPRPAPAPRPPPPCIVVHTACPVGQCVARVVAGSGRTDDSGRVWTPWTFATDLRHGPSPGTLLDKVSAPPPLQVGRVVCVVVRGGGGI